MGTDIKGITAKEARKLAESSDFTLKHIYKVIRERAKENAVSTEWCTYDLSDKALEMVTEGLKEDGFKIENQEKEHRLIIRW